jgi:hypothetical protein
MKMCLAPCYQGCTVERYAEEAGAVESFLATRGESRLVPLRIARDQASADLEFESAAALHAQVQRLESVRALAPELVRPLNQLRTVILQPSAHPDEVAVFVYQDGRLRGPAGFSTLGMRIQNEQSGSSSLFAHPVALEPVPEATTFEVVAEGVAKIPRSLLESRMEAALAILSEACEAPSPTVRQGHLALLKRWYYRPEVRRVGEVFFPNSEGQWPIKALLRGAGRAYSLQFKASSIAQ